MALSRKALGTQRWKDTRLRVLARDGYTCAYCNQEADQVDHIQSRVSGGDVFDMDNLVAACRRCNQSKGSRMNKPLFLGLDSTPPVFSGVSLPDTVMTKPPSPFEKP